MATGMRHKPWAAAALTPLLLLGACGEKRSEGPDAGETDAEVSGGFDGLRAQLEDGVAGRPCREDEDCGGKNARCSPGRPGAVRSCTGLCTEHEQCGEGGTCVEVARLGAQPLSFCQQVCADDSECDPELQCSQAFNAYQLVVSISELLRGAALSGAGAEYTICQERPQTVRIEHGAVGLACEDDEPCGGGQCLAWMPGGYCSGRCMQDQQCGDRGACVRDFVSVTLGLPGNCLLTCTQRSDCREAEDYGCGPLPFVEGGAAASYCVSQQLLDRGFRAGFPRGPDDGGPGGDAPAAGAPAAAAAGDAPPAAPDH
jgi:hypothetical protein